MTEEESDKRANITGDEYFAELDFVECLRNLKAGYRLQLSKIESSSETDAEGNESDSNQSKIKFLRTYRKKKLISRQNDDVEVIFLDSDEDEQGKFFFSNMT
jgi:hypothetical protein